MEEVRSQFRRPVGDEGREVLERMNHEHLPLTRWSLSLISETNPTSVLDVGCGGGLGLRQASELWKNARLTGVDISDDALRFCEERHRDLMEKGMLLQNASADRLTFDSGAFDLVMTFESYFFWDDLKAGLDELGRVTSPGGTILLSSEAYVHPSFQKRNDEMAIEHGLRLYEPEYIASLMPREVFDASIHLLEDRNWMTIVFKKRV